MVQNLAPIDCQLHSAPISMPHHIRRPGTPSTPCTPTTPTTPSYEEAERIAHPFNEIPLTALRDRTRRQLSGSLNSSLVLRSEEGYERNWRGIAMLSQLKYLCEDRSLSGADPMATVLEQWCKNHPRTATFENLENFLCKIDRWDVCDDILENLVEDAKIYAEKQKRQSRELDMPVSDYTDSNANFSLGAESEILTTDDVQLAQKNLPPQQYDAFILFADSDLNYAVDILKNLEENPEYNFKLCLKNRDLLAGVAFTHVALTKLIEERCERLIVILTHKFLESPENKFLVDYAQHLQIRNNTRKIIPLIYEDNVKIPRTLQIYTHLRYNNGPTTGLVNFWLKLACSVRNTKLPLMAETPPPSSANMDKCITLQPLKRSKSDKQPSASTRPSSDIPNIVINGDALAPLPPVDVPPKKKERNKCQKNDSFRGYTANKLFIAEGLVLRNAHSTSQLNAGKLPDTNLTQMTGLSSSTCSSDVKKKKKKWPHKLIKKVFTRSSNRLQEV